MISCADFRSLLLEAGPLELDGVGPSPVAAHVRVCDSCRGLAARVRAETAALDAYLTHDPPALDVDTILIRAAAGARPKAPIPLRVPRRWTALAVAAAIAALLLLPGERLPPETPLRPVQTVQLPTVEASAEHTVAVLETSNPDITVLWFF